MPKAYCPECDAVIRMDEPEIDDQLKCPECRVQLEVISINPFDVYYAYEDENEEIYDDWNDDEDAY
jgi:lysine biosynthesis protein LysW